MNDYLIQRCKELMREYRALWKSARKRKNECRSKCFGLCMRFDRLAYMYRELYRREKRCLRILREVHRSAIANASR